MNIFFRVDSGNVIGTGNIIRCLKMANYFSKHNIFFICKKFQGNLNRKIIENNFKLFELEIDNDNSNINDTNTWLGEDFKIDASSTCDILKKYQVDLLIIDQYSIDYIWENIVKKYVEKI